MKVERFSRLRGCGVFRDFTWPAELPDFGRFNLIYGWNGTGKTTLSRLFRDLELRRRPTMGEATIRIGGRDVGGSEFPQETLPVRVFNRDFINESVFPVGGGDLPPIFVVGKESVEKQKEAERLKEERRKEEAERDAAREAKQKAERDLDQHCIASARVIKDTLRSPGPNPYNNYDKTDYKSDAAKMLAGGDASAHLLTDEEREKLLAQIRARPKQKLPEVSYKLPSLQDLAESVSEILQTTVVAAAIEALKDDASLSEWTRQGLLLHKERKAVVCLFCEQPLPTGRLAALEAHFSTEYENFLRKVDQRITELRAAQESASRLNLPRLAELYEDLADEYSAAERALRDALQPVQRFLGDLIRVLEEKRAKPFDRLPLPAHVPVVDPAVVDRLNAVIRKHNQACDDFSSRAGKARERLALNMIAESLDEFVRLRDAVDRAGKDLAAAEGELSRLTKEIDKLEREIIEHRQLAEELNEDLRKYLGHDELRLEVKETGYSVTRNGQPAYNLSEGETTAIALLYFLKSLLDRSFDIEHGVVVLDDPVSSLDANALYFAYGFIRERTQDAGQLFILTHNFTFFRQVRNWFHHLKGQKKKVVAQRPARFYMLDCARDGDQRCAIIRPLDPLLEEYESEYQYLFARIYRAASTPAPTALEDSYILPNMARRLLESFLAFRRPATSGDLWQKMQSVAFDGAKKLRILRFLNIHSHSDSIGEPEHDPSLLAEAGSVLNDLLEFIEAQDKAHFDAMVKLVNPPAAEEENG